jgi:hypothetical protein
VVSAQPATKTTAQQHEPAAPPPKAAAPAAPEPRHAAHARRHTPAPRNAPEPAETADNLSVPLPEVAPPAVHRARSGTLNVNEF